MKKEYDYEKIYDVVKYILIWKKEEEYAKLSIKFNKLVSNSRFNDNLKIKNFSSYSDAIKSDKKRLKEAEEKRKMLEKEFESLINKEN